MSWVERQESRDIDSSHEDDSGEIYKGESNRVRLPSPRKALLLPLQPSVGKNDKQTDQPHYEEN